MSILIKGMDMPEHCYECLLRQGNCCLLLYEAIPPTVPLTRLDDCPLVEIDDTTISKPRDSQGRFSCGEVDKWVYGERGIKIPVLLEAEE